MKVAIIGSRSLSVTNLQDYIPKETDEIISGGACGVDSSARDYAEQHKIDLTEFLPDYEKFGRRAPLVRNEQIVNHADLVLAFWDGTSRGTRYVIDYARKVSKEIVVIRTTE